MQEQYMYLLIDSTGRFCPTSVLYMDLFEEDLMILHILLLLNEAKKKYLHFESVFITQIYFNYKQSLLEYSFKRNIFVYPYEIFHMEMVYNCFPPNYHTSTFLVLLINNWKEKGSKITLTVVFSSTQIYWQWVFMYTHSMCLHFFYHYKNGRV